MNLDVLALDFDGVLVDSMPGLINITLTCIKKHLGVEFTKQEVKEKASSLSGIPIRESLTRLFAGKVDDEKLAACIKEIYAEISQVEVKTFPGVRETLQTFYGHGFRIVISSAAPQKLIKRWAKKEGVASLISDIFGEEQHSKASHIGVLYCRYKNIYDKLTIFFISDSIGDMGLGDISIAIAPEGEEEKFFNAGAAAVVPCFADLPRKNIRAI